MSSSRLVLGPPIRPVTGADLPDIAWFTPGGDESTDEHWSADLSRTLQVFLNGHQLPVPDDRDER